MEIFLQSLFFSWFCTKSLSAICNFEFALLCLRSDPIISRIDILSSNFCWVESSARKIKVCSSIAQRRLFHVSSTQQQLFAGASVIISALSLHFLSSITFHPQSVQVTNVFASVCSKVDRQKVFLRDEYATTIRLSASANPLGSSSLGISFHPSVGPSNERFRLYLLTLHSK